MVSHQWLEEVGSIQLVTYFIHAGIREANVRSCYLHPFPWCRRWIPFLEFRDLVTRILNLCRSCYLRKELAQSELEIWNFVDVEEEECLIAPGEAKTSGKWVLA